MEWNALGDSISIKECLRTLLSHSDPLNPMLHIDFDYYISGIHFGPLFDPQNPK